MNFLKNLRIALISTIIITVIVCGIYPLFVWGIAQAIFPDKANGSFVIRNHLVVGSSLLAQRFSGAEYFHPRPSSAGDGYDGEHSGGSNLGPLSGKLIHTIRKRSDDYRSENGLPAGSMVPADAVTASASGLDPHISLKNALLQATRVARSRGLSKDYIQTMIMQRMEGKDLGIFGEQRVNVLLLNLALDKGKKN